MRLLLAIWVGKLIYFLTRFLKSGGGSAGPGYYALKIHHGLVKELSKQIPQNVVITGTNGKTTTARMLAHFTANQQQKIVRNASGSNLERGVASTLIVHSNWLGKIEADLGIWELDEAAFNTVVFELKPEIIVFLNAFRDQLDRYGEVDSVVKKWWDSLEKVSWDATIIINRSDANTGSLVAITNDNSHLTAVTFSVKNHFIYHEIVIDAKKEIKPFESDFEAESYKSLGLKGTEFQLKYPAGKMQISLHIPGIYHIYDFLAAFSVYYHLNLPVDDIQKCLEDFSPAFGRVEQIKLGHIEGYIFLIKNPAGANQVFETLAPEIKPNDILLIALNDNFADGKDVSWIWDAGFELLLKPENQKIRESENQTKKPKAPMFRSSLTSVRDVPIFCSGSRAQDLALRLKYAGAGEKQLKIENDLNKALSEASSYTTGRIFILPTYTSLLELQAILAKMGVKKHYWKEEI